MINITFFSLSALSLFSISPLYTITNRYQLLSQTAFCHSRFSYSFTSILVSHTNNHKTNIQNSVFSFMLESPIKLTSKSQENNFTPFNSNCSFNTNQPIGGKKLNGDMLGDHHNIIFIHDCGDIIITGCIFNNCYSNGPGGSIYILQNCSVIIHNTIFNSSHTQNITGGAIFAACNIYQEEEYFKNEQIKQIDIQYCCFQNCYGSNNGPGTISPVYGIAIFSAATNNVLFYASTVNCPGENGIVATGAQFDLQGTNVSSKYVNSTGGNSDFCGGIEYRHASDGFFRFQTISDMKCMFSVSYTDILNNKIELSLSNIYNVTLRRAKKMKDERVFSGLIHIRQTHQIEISNFSFIDNIMNDTIFVHDGKTHTDYAKIISRGADSQGIQNINIDLINCYYSCSNDKVIYTTNCEIITENCHPNANLDDLNDIPQLDLGECKGNVTAKPLTPTYQFTDSSYFTFSKEFTKSNVFTESEMFTKSSIFTNSDVFSSSKIFTNSDIVSQSFTFSQSDAFINNIGINSNNKDKVNIGMIAGIASGVAAVAAAGIAAFFLIKKKSVGAPVDANTITNTQTQVKNENPLYSKEAEEDPFKDDFAV